MVFINTFFIFAVENKVETPLFMKPTQHIIQYIREARQRGHSLNRICKELALCPAVVSRWLRMGFGTGANG